MSNVIRILITCVASAVTVIATVTGIQAQGRQPFEPEMVHIPGGTFMMGSRDDPRERDKDDVPLHRVRISPFEASKHEITWDQWEACVRDDGCDDGGPQKAGGDAGWGKGDRPVIFVSWNDAQDYVAWLQRKTGKAYRLLSEAEWEYAARAGSTARYAWGDQDPVCDEKARNGVNFIGCPDDRTRPVGSFRVNDFGLYDMEGNVWEWVEDCWHRSYLGAPTDGSAWTTNCTEDRRVLRGGAWFSKIRFLSLAYCGYNRSDFRFNGIGFRIARTL